MVIVLDQVSKYMIRSNLEIGEILKITKNFFWVTYVQNTGAAFSLSLGSDTVNRIFFIAFTIIATIIIFYIFLKAKNIIEKISFALILGGAIGNLIDRIIIGSVTDFLWCDFPDFLMHRWPVFNIADSSIVIALTLMIIYFIFFEKKHLEEK
ncbi:MAG: signal peptidase II [Candidatus Cloacimonetes bacterium]|nr:signal peptidase II [Candidatus Cloacimonadota bacterium]